MSQGASVEVPRLRGSSERYAVGQPLTHSVLDVQKRPTLGTGAWTERRDGQAP